MQTHAIPEDFIPAPGFMENRTLLITGGGGLGKATAQACASYGANVILLGRTLAKLEAVYDQITDAGCPEPALYPMNLEGAASKDYEDLAGVLQTEFGKLDGLIHNAAFLGSLTPTEHYEAELWLRVMQVNVNGPMMMTQALLPLLRASATASLTFVSDRMREPPKPYWGAYAVSKYAQFAFMQTLASEAALDRRLRVNAYDPGPMNTRLRTQAYPGIDPNTWAKPEERTRGLLYLLSEASNGVNGELVV